MSDTRDGARETLPGREVAIAQIQARYASVTLPEPPTHALIEAYDAGRQSNRDASINHTSAKAELPLDIYQESCGTIHVAIRLLRQKLDAGSSQVAALQKVAGRYEEKMSCGHPRRYLTTSTPNASDLICAECKRSALARRNEQLEAENARLRGGQGAAMALNNKGEPSKKGGALLEKRTQL